MGDDEINMKQYRGFTIVELLIVIVVIGILAAITIVAYNGMQWRAKNSSIEQSVLTYKKALDAYVVTNGQYPTPTTSVCLGEVAAYPDGCYAGGNANATFVSEMKKVISTLPSPDGACFTAWGGCRKNFAFYRNTTWTVDGVLHQYYLIYYIGGGASCGIPTTLEGTYGTFATTSTRGYMERRGSESMCVLALPDPASS